LDERSVRERSQKKGGRLVRRGIRESCGGTAEGSDWASPPTTHDLLRELIVGRWALEKRPRLRQTDGEFHTIRRQFGHWTALFRKRRGFEIVKVSAFGPSPPSRRAARRAAGRTIATAAVLASSILDMKNGERGTVPNSAAWRRLWRWGRAGSSWWTPYHQINVIFPFPSLLCFWKGGRIRGGGHPRFVTAAATKVLRAGGGKRLIFRVPPGAPNRSRPIVTVLVQRACAQAPTRQV